MPQLFSYLFTCWNKIHDFKKMMFLHNCSMISCFRLWCSPLVQESLPVDLWDWKNVWRAPADGCWDASYWGEANFYLRNQERKMDSQFQCRPSDVTCCIYVGFLRIDVCHHMTCSGYLFLILDCFCTYIFYFHVWG